MTYLGNPEWIQKEALNLLLKASFNYIYKNTV